MRGDTATLLRGTHSFYPVPLFRAKREDCCMRECAGMSLEDDALRLTICEVDGEEPVRAIETLELHLATLGELDS